MLEFEEIICTQPKMNKKDIYEQTFRFYFDKPQLK